MLLKNDPRFIPQDGPKRSIARQGNHVIISGMQTQYCVDTTTRRAFSEGYKVTLVSDAHSTFDTEVLRAEDIVKHHNVVFGAFADVITLKDLKETVSK